jgi:hypothetical protein
VTTTCFPLRLPEPFHPLTGLHPSGKDVRHVPGLMVISRVAYVMLTPGERGAFTYECLAHRKVDDILVVETPHAIYVGKEVTP